MSEQAHWYCVRTKTKRERVATQSLKLVEGVEVLCPRLKYQKVTKRGKVWWSEAMFPGYIFVKFVREEHERLVMHTQGVMCLVKFGADVPIVPEGFMVELQKSLSEVENDEVLLRPTMNEGDDIEVAFGAFEGEMGTVVEVLPATDRVKILIDLMGSPQVVDVDLFSLLRTN